jgi:hypothetical protein
LPGAIKAHGYPASAHPAKINAVMTTVTLGTSISPRPERGLISTWRQRAVNYSNRLPVHSAAGFVLISQCRP